MARRSESDYREVVFERESKEPLHGFMRVDRRMVIVRGYGRHKESRVGSSPPELIARLLLSELENAARGEADQKTEQKEQKRMGGEYSQPKIRPFGASMIACAAGILENRSAACWRPPRAGPLSLRLL
jgi:hypothetical protein